MPNVATFIDYENIHYTMTNYYKVYPDPDEVARVFSEVASRRGAVLLAKAYADWANFTELMGALRTHGFEPVYVASKLRSAPERGPIKNSADIQMTMDIMDVLYTRPDIEIFILFTGDQDFLPVLHRLRGAGKITVVSGFRATSSRELFLAAREVVELELTMRLTPIVRPSAPPKKPEEIKDNWRPLIRRLYKLSQVLPFVSFTYLRDKMWWRDLKPSPQKDEEKQAYLNRAKAAGIIRVKKVKNPNPRDPNFPLVSACVLTDHPEVVRVLNEMQDRGKREGSK